VITIHDRFATRSEGEKGVFRMPLKHRTLAQRYDYLSKYANDIILLVHPDGNILDANERALAAYGYTLEELLHLTIRDIRSPETWDDIPKQMQQVKTLKGLVFETVHRRKDGSTFPVEISARLIELKEQSYLLSIARDVTERRLAEISLINEKNRSEAIIAAIGEGITIHDRNFRILYENRIHKDMFGDNVGEYCYQAYQHRNEPCEVCAMAESFRDGMIHTRERSASTDRGLIQVEITASPLKNESGEIVAGIEVVRDITTRKKAERRLANLNECFLSFHADPDENINLLVALCGEQLNATCALYNRLDGKILNALGQWHTPPDFNATDTAEGHICYDVIKEGSKDVRMIRDLMGTPYAKTDPNVVRYGLKTYIGKSVAFNGVSVGSLCMVYQHDHVLSQDELRFLEIIASAIGVEESRKGMLSSRLESENRYRHLIESVTDYIYTVTVENGQAVSTTHGPGCAAVTGYTPSDFQADPGLWYRLIFDGDRHAVIEKANMILAGASLAPFEHRIIHKDGSIRWVRNTPVSRYDNEGRLVAYDGLITDITRLILLENQLRQAQKMEAVGQLAGGIAHDFNNILTAIIGYSHLLLTKMEEGSQGHQFAEQIITSSERAAHLTRSLLSFSRNQVMDVKTVDLNTIIERSEHFLERVIGEDIEFRTMRTKNELPVLADVVQIEQVMMNLAANARDAMPNGGILLIETKEVLLGEDFIRANSYGRPGKFACLSVTDSGLGMDASTRSRIFEPFFTTKEVGKGTGLGLSMVYGIIKQHHGYVNVYSEPGKGTTFNIYLPLLAIASVDTPTPAHTQIAQGTETVLLAEDDKIVRDLTKYVLEGAGYQVVEVTDGEEAVQKFSENRERIDLLVFDIIMPKKSGKDAYLKIKAIRPDIKVLFMSGYTTDNMNSKGILEAGLDFVMKPISPSEFLKKVRNILDRR
jgi:PAS domain S-box-containing protein